MTADKQTHALTRVLTEEPRFALYAISAPSEKTGNRTVCAYCKQCNRQEAVFVITRSGRVTRKPGDGSKWDPEVEIAPAST